MFPIQDLNPTRRTPVVTFGLIVLNVLVFLWQMTMTDQQLARMYFENAVVPAAISADPLSLEAFLDSIRSMFMHGGYAHIASNMLYLFLFGDNIEDRCGRIVFLLLYFASGFAAIAAQVLIEPNSPIPLIGASGAIAGVLGSYLITFPLVRVRGIIPLGFIPFFTELPAFIVLGLWFVFQLISGFASLGAPYQGSGGGIAFFAHIGGFVTGVVITLLLMWMMPQPPARQREAMLYDRAKRYWNRG